MIHFLGDMQVVLSWVNRPLFHISGEPVTFGGICAGILIFLAVMIVSAIMQQMITKQLKRNPRLSSNSVIYAVNRIIHYAFVILGILLATECIGLNLGTLAVAFGFLGVGVGFGLQNLTSNFVSGIIILIERPIGIGDHVDLNGRMVEVVNINIRSTTVQTADGITVIVPNSKFVENEVVNWSLDDPKVRLHCPVGVAYGSDVQLVKKFLLEIARQQKDVMASPEPEVKFMEFGDCALKFELLVWIPRPENQKSICSDINFAIERVFRENDIKMPFPQRVVPVQLPLAASSLADSLPQKGS